MKRYRKTRPPTSCHQNSGSECNWIREANLDTFTKEQSLVSPQSLSIKDLIEVLIGADLVLGLKREAEFSTCFENDSCHTPWEERVQKATLLAIQSSLMPRSLSPPLSAPSDVIAAKTGSQLREERARDEKSTLWKRLGETSRWAIPSEISLSKSIGSDSNVLTSAAAFEKGWDNTTSSCKGSSAAFMPWSTSPESSEMSIAYSDSGCAVIGDGTKRIQRWLTVRAVSENRAWIKSIVCLATANRR